MQKIIVIGCPGSGKTTFAEKLNKITGIPLYYLDAIWHKPDRTHISREEYDARLAGILALDCWIIDGNYQSTMEWRIAACDLVVFLDFSTEVCLGGVSARRGQARSDIPWVEDGEDSEFLTFITAFQTESRPDILTLLGKYPHKAVLTFTTRDEADAYLDAISASASEGA